MYTYEGEKNLSHFLTLRLNEISYLWCMKKVYANYTASAYKFFPFFFKFSYAFPFSFTHVIFSVVVFANIMQPCWGGYIIFYMAYKANLHIVCIYNILYISTFSDIWQVTIFIYHSCSRAFWEFYILVFLNNVMAFTPNLSCLCFDIDRVKNIQVFSGCFLFIIRWKIHVVT